MAGALDGSIRRVALLPFEAVILGATCALTIFGELQGVGIVFLLALCGVIAAVRVLSTERLVIPLSPYPYAGVLLAAVACVSAIFAHGGMWYELFGATFGIGALGLYVVFALYMLGGSVFSHRSLKAFLYGFEIFTVLATYVAYIFHAVPWDSHAALLCLGACASPAVGAALASRNVPARLWHTAVALVCGAGVAVLIFYGAQSAAPQAPFFTSAQVLAVQDLSSLQGALIGAGPQSFDYAWNKHRPVDANLLPLWKAPPDAAYDSLISFSITTGLLGLAAFAFGPLALLYLIYRRKQPHESPQMGLFAAFFALSLVTLGIAAVASLGPSLFLALAFSTGAGMRALGVVPLREIRLRDSAYAYVGGAIAICALGLCVIGVLQSTALRADEAGQAIMQSSPDLAAIDFQKAAKTWPAPVYMKDAALATVAQAVEKARTELQADDLSAPALLSYIETAESFSNQSVAADPINADLYLARANVYLSAASLGVPGAAQHVHESLGAAQQLAPTRADVYYDEAVFSVFSGDTNLAREYLTKALALKPDYEGAQKLLATLGS